MSGANNPFWGRHHTEETKAGLAAMQAPKKARRYGPGKGGFKHTQEARAAISAAVREDWRLNRDKRMAAVEKASKTQRANNISEGPRYRLVFTETQRANWLDKQCLWCDATEDLVLDHVVAVMCGGVNRQSNAQTLCRRCNLWKVKYVDRPMLLATLDARGASN